MTNRHRPHTARQRGSAYITVLGAASLVTILGVSALMATRIQRKAIETNNAAGEARLLARSAVELALQRIDEDAGWRAGMTGDTLFKVEADGATLAAEVIEKPFNSSLSSDDTELTITGAAVQGDATQMMRGTFRFDHTRSPIASAILADGPVGYWPLNETGGSTAKNLVGRRHGTTYLGVSFGQDGPTTASLSAQFDGHDAFVEVPHHEGFHTAEGAISVWFKSRDTGAQQGLVNKDTHGLGTGGHIGLWIDGGYLYGRIQSATAEYQVKASGLQPNTWHHAAVTFGPAGFKLYLDGRLVGSKSYTGGLDDTSSGGDGNREPICIGVRSGLVENPHKTPWNIAGFNGWIAHAAFFDDQLSGDAIAIQHTAGFEQPKRRLVPGTWQRVVE